MNDLRQRAIKLLARREHTRAELARKLAGHGTREEIDAVIAELAAQQLQSDERFAAAWLRAHAARLGSTRLRHGLRQKGVDEETTAHTLGEAGLDDEAQRARALWQRRFHTAPTDRAEWARQARFLQARGFASALIVRVVPAVDTPEDALDD